MNRVFNAVAAATGLFLLLPLFAIVALAIKLHDRGPVFYAQARVGKGFKMIRVLKFRSMIPHADRAGPLTAKSDRRITSVGRILRRYKIDELPQLWNVLRGDMQMVGPRPEVRRYVEEHFGQYELLLRQPPGITDPASLAYRHEENLLAADGMEERYLSQILPDKLRLSLEYQGRRTFFSDLGVLFQTVVRVILADRGKPLHHSLCK